MNMNKISKRSNGWSLKTRRAWKPGQLLLRRSWHRLRVLSYWINRKPENFVLLARKINSLRKGETRGRDHLRQTHCTRLTSLKHLIKICQQCSPWHNNFRRPFYRRSIPKTSLFAIGDIFTLFESAVVSFPRFSEATGNQTGCAAVFLAE